MKGSVIKGISKINLIKKSKRSYFGNNSILDENRLLNKGYFNGKLLGCDSYDIKNTSLGLKCSPIEFFDFMSLDKEKLPKLVNVNAIIVLDKKYLMIKRPSNVFSYPGYWDFPAGLVFFKDGLIEVLFDRIKKEINLSKKLFSKPKLSLVHVSKKYFSLFYYLSLRLSKSQKTELIKRKNLVLLSSTELKKFLLKEKVVFKDVIEEIIL